MAFPGWNSWVVSGYVNVGIWKKVSGAWSLVTTDYASVYTDVGSAGSHTVGWSLYNTYAMGAGVTDWGATIEDTDASGGATLTYMNVSYTVQATSGTRSATPNGETATVTVRP